MTSNIPLLEIIHKTNHTQYRRVCAVNTRHSLGQTISARLSSADGSYIFEKLKPGLYSVDIDNERYYFDLYEDISSQGFVKIINPHRAFVYKDGIHRNIINLYKQTAIINTKLNEFMIQNTMNDYIDMIVIDGQTSSYTATASDLDDFYAVMPKNGILPTEQELINWHGTMDDMLVDNIVWNHILLSNEHIENIDTDDYENFAGEKPWVVSSTSIVAIATNQEDDMGLYAVIPKNGIIPRSTLQAMLEQSFADAGDDNVIWDGILIYDQMDYLEIILKNNLKALPDGTKDTFILNSEQQKHHIIYRVGRRIMTGNELWFVANDYCTDDYYIFYTTENNAKDDNSKNNIVSTHFYAQKSSVIFNKELSDEGICIGYTEKYGRGFYVKISKNFFEFDSDNPTQALIDYIKSEYDDEHPFIIEYALLTYKYRTILIDEYHAKTYFPRTLVRLNDFYNISYFYKTASGADVDEFNLSDYLSDDTGLLAIVPKNGEVPRFKEISTSRNQRLYEVAQNNIILDKITTKD